MTRLVGPLLGDDTRRRRFAQRLRPDQPDVVVVREEVATFPLDYVATLRHNPSTSAAWGHVEIVEATPGDNDGLVAGLRRALDSAKDWVLIVDARSTDDERHEVAATLYERRDDADVVFADEVGDRAGIPLLKPREVGPHTLLSYNLVGRPALLRRDAVARVGGLRADAGRAGEHDLYLRLFEVGARFRHLPLVLAGRRPEDRRGRDLADDTRRVVSDALQRRGVNARVVSTPLDTVVSWSPVLPQWPSIDILIPTRDRVDLLRQCISSVESSTYPNYTITILDNDSRDPATLDYLAGSPHRVVDCAGPFNYAAIINRGVAQSTAQFVLTLNNDTIVRTPDWLERMVAVSSLDDVSIVGVTLVDERGIHEHDAIVIAPYPQHLRRGVNYLVDDESVVSRRDVSAVTGAVQLIDRSLYEGLGGMDEELAVVMNDVDLCLRSQVDGRHVVVLPDVVLSHFAGSSRGRLDPIVDRNRFVRRWDVFGSLRDPYFPEALRLYGQRMHYCTPVPE
ncbi:MAG: glycosyltransferase [Acidobacteria bacterium]|nr:glycosyltransferase [Acidobacteriota bacterium]